MSSVGQAQCDGALEGRIVVPCVIIVNEVCPSFGCIGSLVGAAKAYGFV